ncbi:MAG: hypothetical protein FJY97_06150 [candidate division Zixibacteria bacterium]|nr:hypothetical protein [candidate division Zixibacteria bacterium]
MNRTEAWFVHLSTLLVGVTGIVYAIMRYGMTSVDEFAIVNHPWQADVQHYHILFAPLLVFAVGLIWKRHIATHYRMGLKTGRRSGVEMVLSLVPMTVSGYLIQVTSAEPWRNIWIVVHVTTSGLWLAGYAVHQFMALRRKRESASDNGTSVPEEPRQPAAVTP